MMSVSSVMTYSVTGVIVRGLDFSDTKAIAHCWSEF